MNLLRHCAVRGIPDSDSRLCHVQVPKDSHSHIYQSPDVSIHSTAHQPSLSYSEDWWPPHLKELFDDEQDEYYLGRLTFLSRPVQRSTGDLAIEYLGGGVTRRWRWTGSGVTPALSSRLVDEEAPATTEELAILPFDDFVARYVTDFFDQRRRNTDRYNEKRVDGEYVSSPDLHASGDDEAAT
mgnify:FL=1